MNNKCLYLISEQHVAIINTTYWTSVGNILIAINFPGEYFLPQSIYYEKGNKFGVRAILDMGIWERLSLVLIIIEFVKEIVTAIFIYKVGRGSKSAVSIEGFKMDQVTKWP